MSIFNNSLFGGELWNGNIIVGNSPNDDIVINGLGLQNRYITTRYVRHKSGHETELIMTNIARSHGVRVQALYRRGKMITISGMVKADDHEGLIDRVDNVKKFLRVINGLLKVRRGGKIRQYYTTLQNPQSIFESEDAFHNTMIPFNLQLFVPFFGFSENRKIYTDQITAATYSRALVHEGNADEGRIITIFVINSATDLTKIQWENQTTGKVMTVEPDGGFSAGDVLKVDGENQIVTLNGVEVDSRGEIPALVPDSNAYRVTFTSTNHSVTMTNKFYNYYS